MTNSSSTILDTRSALVADDVVELGEQRWFNSRQGSNVFCHQEIRLAVSGFDMKNWVASTFSSYVMYSNYRLIGEGVIKDVTRGPVRADFYVSKRGVDLTFFGDRADVEAARDWIHTHPGFREEGPEISWVHGDNPANMETYNLPLKLLPPIEGAYPWLPCSAEDYTARFMASSENILVLLGVPGTGKTSLIKEMIKNSGKSAMISYNTHLLMSDSFFVNFMTRDQADLLIIEDSDDILRPREDGNNVMHKFLNVADGLVSLGHKKLVFTTNLPSVDDIDPALIRPGRCYEVLTSRPLTVSEAMHVRAKAGLPEMDLSGKEAWTLAETLNKREQRSQFVAKKVGFY